MRQRSRAGGKSAKSQRRKSAALRLATKPLPTICDQSTIPGKNWSFVDCRQPIARQQRDDEVAVCNRCRSRHYNHLSVRLAVQFLDRMLDLLSVESTALCYFAK